MELDHDLFGFVWSRLEAFFNLGKPNHGMYHFGLTIIYIYIYIMYVIYIYIYI